MQAGSRTVRGYGSTAAREWYAELPEAVRDLVDFAGFGHSAGGYLTVLSVGHCLPLWRRDGGTPPIHSIFLLLGI